MNQQSSEQTRETVSLVLTPFCAHSDEVGQEPFPLSLQSGFKTPHSPEYPRGRTPHACYCSSPLVLSSRGSVRVYRAAAAAGR